MKILHKLKLKLAKESLARMRVRVKRNLKAGSDRMQASNRFMQGENGYDKDERTYGGTK